jgi:hypothetical protein
MTDIDGDSLEAAIQELMEESFPDRNLNTLNEAETCYLHNRTQQRVSIKLAGLAAEEWWSADRSF